MLITSIEAPGESGEHVESERVFSIAVGFGKIGKSGTAVIFRKKLVISETDLADRMIEAQAKLGRVFGES